MEAPPARGPPWAIWLALRWRRCGLGERIADRETVLEAGRRSMELRDCTGLLVKVMATAVLGRVGLAGRPRRRRARDH
ncbi:hypothetical protein HYQ46_007316 [Verticillium longisporum]|nr:hypothetical protein HYQ46_007316 [Verticillium longisporum]